MSKLAIAFIISGFLGGLIGWITNWLAIKCLFHPYKSFNLVLFEFQGLLPKRQKELAQKLGELVEKQLINAEDLANKIELQDIYQMIDEIVKNFRNDLENSIKDFIKSSKIGMLISLNGAINSIMSRVEDMAKDILKKKLPDIIESCAKKAAEKISVQEIVSEKISNMQLAKLEQIFNDISDKEMRAILWLGGLIGVVVGLAQQVIQTYFLH